MRSGVERSHQCTRRTRIALAPTLLPARRARERPHASIPRLYQNPLRAVVPDIHLDDERRPAPRSGRHSGCLRTACRRSIRRTACRSSRPRSRRAGADVEAVHLLLHPAIARRVEAGRPARVIEFAPAGKGDDGAGLHIGRRRRRDRGSSTPSDTPRRSRRRRSSGSALAATDIWNLLLSKILQSGTQIACT